LQYKFGRMKRFSTFQLVFIALGSLVLLFVIAPLAGMFFSTPIADVVESAKDKEVIDSIQLTLWTAMLATVLFSFAAVPLAYVMARKDFLFKRLILGIIDLPVVIPHTAAGIAILGFVSRDTTLGKIADYFGLSFVGGQGGIVLAMAFVSVPILFNAARDGFMAVPVRLEKAALNLGASPFKVFFSISLPLAWRSVVSGAIMMFARGMSEFGAVVIIAYHPMITPILIYERFGAFGLKYAQSVSVVFILVCLVFFILMRLLSKEKKYAES